MLTLFFEVKFETLKKEMDLKSLFKNNDNLFPKRKRCPILNISENQTSFILCPS